MQKLSTLFFAKIDSVFVYDVFETLLTTVLLKSAAVVFLLKNCEELYTFSFFVKNESAFAYSMFENLTAR